MARRRNYNQDCPIANGLDVLGERWTLLIVREPVGGPRRYSDLRAQLPGIATNLLAQRLDELEQAGVVERTELPGRASGSIPGSSTERRSIARLDSRDSCGSVGSAKQLEVHPASGQQVVNAALEVT